MSTHLLLIDDEPAILIAFKKLLQNDALLVDTAESAEDARELIRRVSYDAVVADVCLSGFSNEEGLDIIREVKMLNPSTRIIMITAFATQDVRKRAFRLGAEFYLEKPVSTTVIKDALKKMGLIGAMHSHT
jgi:YesN/AraC family two-component response regulator